MTTTPFSGQLDCSWCGQSVPVSRINPSRHHGGMVCDRCRCDQGPKECDECFGLGVVMAGNAVALDDYPCPECGGSGIAMNHVEGALKMIPTLGETVQGRKDRAREALNQEAWI